jgi:hypothetical protein
MTISCFRCSLDVDVEVAEPYVSLINDVLIIVDVTAIIVVQIFFGFFNQVAIVEEPPCGCQRVYSVCVLQMIGDTVISETTSFAKIRRSLPST